MYTDRVTRTGPQASSVSPNPKCDGCLHYLSQAGPTGACEIGEKPFKCGDGSDPMMGYAPVTATGPTMPNDLVQIGQANAGPSPNAGLERMKIEVLGEESVEMVKSIAAEYEKQVRAACTLHSQRGNVLQQNTSLAYTEATCSCVPVSDRVVAKSFASKLNNRQRSVVGDIDIMEFVIDVRKSAGDRGGHVIGHTKSGKPVYGPTAGYHKAYNKVIGGRSSGEKGGYTAAKEKSHADYEKEKKDHSDRHSDFTAEDHMDAHRINLREFKNQPTSAKRQAQLRLASDTHSNGKYNHQQHFERLYEESKQPAKDWEK